MMNIRDRVSWFITIETIDAKFVKVNSEIGYPYARGCYLDRRVECGPRGGKVVLWRRENRRGIGYPYTNKTPAGVWHKTQYNAIHSHR
tara:strand:+ start:590 stop:853 length:264 start_codon:yes stop_codon:yes gene_type:complete